MKTWKEKLTTHRFLKIRRKDFFGRPAWNRWILSRASLIWTSIRDSKEVKVHFWRPKSPIDARACFTKISSFRSRKPRVLKKLYICIIGSPSGPRSSNSLQVLGLFQNRNKAHLRFWSKGSKVFSQNISERFNINPQQRNPACCLSLVVVSNWIWTCSKTAWIFSMGV